MKPRARRITIGAAVFVAGTVALLVVTHWSTVRDRVEAWHFQLTKETETIEPGPALMDFSLSKFEMEGRDWVLKACLMALAA